MRGSTPTSLQIGADLVELAAVEADAALEHLVAQHLLLQLLEDRLRFDLPLDLAFGQRRDQLLEHLVDALVVLELAADPHRLAERDERLLLDLAVELARDFLLRDLALLLADCLREIVDGVDDLPDGGVRGVERLDHLLFGDLLRAGLDHHDAVAAAGDDRDRAGSACRCG